VVLTANAVDQVERLLDDGLSQRAIARMTGVSRGSVHRIKTGKRVIRGRSNGDELEAPSGPVDRCPGCGGLVQQPCVACRTRETPVDRLSGRDDVDALALDLEADDRRRHRELKKGGG